MYTLQLIGLFVQDSLFLILRYHLKLFSLKKKKEWNTFDKLNIHTQVFLNNYFEMWGKYILHVCCGNGTYLTPPPQKKMELVQNE